MTCFSVNCWEKRTHWCTFTKSQLCQSQEQQGVRGAACASYGGERRMQGGTCSTLAMSLKSSSAFHTAGLTLAAWDASRTLCFAALALKGAGRRGVRGALGPSPAPALLLLLLPPPTPAVARAAASACPPIPPPPPPPRPRPRPTPPPAAVVVVVVCAPVAMAAAVAAEALLRLSLGSGLGLKGFPSASAHARERVCVCVQRTWREREGGREGEREETFGCLGMALVAAATGCRRPRLQRTHAAITHTHTHTHTQSERAREVA